MEREVPGGALRGVGTLMMSQSTVPPRMASSVRRGKLWTDDLSAQDLGWGALCKRRRQLLLKWHLALARIERFGRPRSALVLSFFGYNLDRS
eukprot:2221839-Amphidinium_carterae.1